MDTGDPWFLSCILSRECSLSSKWTSTTLGTSNDKDSNVFFEASDTDFTDLASGHSGPQTRGTGGLIYTTSICGQFLLVGRETIIYIYDLRSGDIAPATSVICPRRVLATSMDVSSGRNAVAALLEGRMGMVCELQYGQSPKPELQEDIVVEKHDQPYRTSPSTSALRNRESGLQARVDAADRKSILTRDLNSYGTSIESVDVQSNHQAISLQEVDDYHKLFMGCDAPLGGPTKLIRKIMFVPPSPENQAPRLYTSAFDMSWGARVVVVFGETLVLYNIPPDVCNLSCTEQKADSWDVYTAPPFSDQGRTDDHWLNWWDGPASSDHWGNNPVWPIAIRGTEVGRLKGVCEVAIQTRPDITIWGFTLDSHGYDPESSVGFDGNSSQIMNSFIRGDRKQIVKKIPRALSVENDEWIDFLDVRGCDAWFEENGDVMMVPWDVHVGGMELEAEIQILETMSGDMEG
ncbi:hypothetical protein N0V90_003256 [Kalmusia sp. IMI 367209]|nr:hypothetical protein N0V90_003256 [Kalmusia sp. IMI 367209]